MDRVMIVWGEDRYPEYAGIVARALEESAAQSARSAARLLEQGEVDRADICLVSATDKRELSALARDGKGLVSLVEYAVSCGSIGDLLDCLPDRDEWGVKEGRVN